MEREGLQKIGLVRNGVRPGRGRFHEAHCFRVRRNPREILGTRQSSFRLPTTGLLARSGGFTSPTAGLITRLLDPFRVLVHAALVQN